MLKSETNKKEIKKEIIRLANMEVVFEHGQWWLKVAGKTFAVVDTNNGLDFVAERILNMKLSKYYKPNGIYQDKAGTLYTIKYLPKCKIYGMWQLDSRNQTIANSGCTFTRWINELKYVCERKL